MDSPLGALGNLADTIVIKDGNVFLVAMRDGRLPAEVEHPLGLWFLDCRFLCVHEACQPQAWAAGSIPFLLKWGLGLSPDALEKRLAIVRPSLPRWLNRVEVTGLALGEARVELVFERAGEHVTLADAHIDGNAELVLEIAGDRRGLVTDP